MAVYLALGFAFLIAALSGTDDPPPSTASVLVFSLTIGAVFQLGLFWAPSARGRQRFYAALLMIPSGFILCGSAFEQVTDLFGAPMIAFQSVYGAVAALTPLAGACGSSLRWRAR